MFYYFLLLALILLIIFCIITYKIYRKIDCDLTLLFFSWFGKSRKLLSTKTIWITGASSGIGEHIAYELAKLNCKLILSGTSIQRLEIVKSRCLSLMDKRTNEDNILIVPFDLTNFDVHRKALDKVLGHFETVDILINNAGRSQRAAFEEIQSIELDKELFDINVFGTINLTRILINYWFKNNQKGHFVVVSSTAGIFPAPFSSTYTATKHALHGYFESLNLEAYSRNIDVTMIVPGPIVSNIAKNAVTATGKRAEIEHTVTDKRVQTDRCAYLITIATVNKLSQVWIALNPVLLLHYFYQYAPTIARFILPRVLNKEFYAKYRDQK